MRRIAALFLGLLLTAPLLLTIGFLGCKSANYKASIERALHEDALTGHEATLDHTAAMQQVDMSGCPDDFRAAYADHIKAWEQAGKVHQAIVDLNNNGTLEAAAITVFGPHAAPWASREQAASELDRLQKAASNEIHTTWARVTAVAQKYGAQVPQ
jgi:ABC-type transport system involved in cytochrome bd biosynthesis fused ATPase/permease subunit